MRAGTGTDVITDFEDGIDSLVLAGGLTFERLEIPRDGGATSIKLAGTDQVLATLNGLENPLISVQDFTVF